MKKAIFLIFIVLGMQNLFAQEDKKSENIYDPARNAQKDIDSAVKMARNNGKNVLIQVGGNWCPWCLRIHKFINSDVEIKKFLQEGYEYVLVNFSKENKNEEAISMLQNPIRFGFPVFIVLDGDGKVIHIQDSGYLEEDKSYSKEKILRFIKLWTPQAIMAKNRQLIIVL